jgi:predicted lysophospholipase L1 biosynthesis ABC-type transport system permease subunit
VTVRFPASASGSRADRVRVVVTADADRDPVVALSVDPGRPTVLVRPEARLALTNRWNRTLTPRVTLEGPGVESTRSVELGPGETVTVEQRLARRPTGEYTVEATVGNVQRRTRYTVVGDDRLATALADSREGATGVERALETTFGNLNVVLAVFVLLAGAMTVGGTTATFAQAVHARRRTVGVRRATGATPRQVAGLVLGDAVRVGTVASALAVAVGIAGLGVLSRWNLLTAFGVRVPPVPSLAVVAGIAVGALAVTVLGAALATAMLLSTPPARLLGGERAGDGGPAGGEDGDA